MAESFTLLPIGFLSLLPKTHSQTIGWICLERLQRLVKVVSGYKGSKRITIPKEISEKIGLKEEDYVIVRYEGNGKITVAPAEISMRE